MRLVQVDKHGHEGNHCEVSCFQPYEGSEHERSGVFCAPMKNTAVKSQQCVFKRVATSVNKKFHAHSVSDDHALDG